MRIKELVTKARYEETDTVCNICEARFSRAKFDGTYSLLDDDKGPGYSTFEICAKCVKEQLFPLFKIPATRREDEEE